MNSTDPALSQQIDTFSDNSTWQSATLTQVPFFMKNEQSLLEPAIFQNFVFQNGGSTSGLSLAVRENALAITQDKWYTSPDLPLASLSVQPDQNPDFVDVYANFDSVGMSIIANRAELITDLDVI